MTDDSLRAPLDVDALRRELGLWSRLDVVETTGSTNADLLATATEPEADRRVLIAEHQVSGRGRHARSWVTPPRAQIAMSVLLRMRDIDPAALGWLSLLTGVAVVDVLIGTAGVDARLKWPNDVLIDGRKVAGILAEVAQAETDRFGSAPGGLAVVVGIGLNVSLTEAELPVPHATSLALAGAAVTDRNVLVPALLRELAQRWRQWQQANWDTAVPAEAYRARCATIGSSVRAELPGGEVLTGTAVDVDADGRLLVETESGARAVSAADVTHLRAT